MHFVVHIAIIEWRHRSMYLKLSMNCEQIHHNSYECRGLFPLACLKHADKKSPMDPEFFLFCFLFFESLTSFRHVDNMFFMNLVVYVRRSIDSRSSLYSKFESFSIILIGIDV